MSDSLDILLTTPLETREESLTRQFYEWEARGRGWHVRDYPVQLEPPFRPLIIFDPDGPEVTDDGRKPTFLSSLFEKKQPAKVSHEPNYRAYRERIAELDEPEPCDYYEEEFIELQLVLPNDLRVTKSVSEQFISSLSYCIHPISFEVIGTKDTAVVQFAASERDIVQVQQQLRAFLPDATIRESGASGLPDSWHEVNGYSMIVDFGLSQEFIIPLRSASNLETDALVPVVGALAGLEESEVGVFQVLFKKARSNWATEILDSVRFFDGTPFFVNAPEMIPFAKEKVKSDLFATVVRVAVKGRSRGRACQMVRNIAAGLSSLSSPTGNQLIPLSSEGYHSEYHEQALLNRLSFRGGMLLNLDELSALVHAPTASVRSANLLRDQGTTKAAPLLTKGHSVRLGENLHENHIAPVTLSDEQRTKHVHLIGSSGSGKSTLLLSLIKQDMQNDHGICVIDPHGDLIDSVIANVPEARVEDVVLFDPSDSEFPIGFNILQANSELEKTILSTDLNATFRRMSTTWGDVMDSVLANAILAFVESPRGGTLFELKRFLVEPEFRRDFLTSVMDDSVRYFWENEFPSIVGKPQASILIRLDSFMRQKMIRHIVCQRENRLNFRSMMDKRKILLVKLSQGLMGEENAYLLGSMIVSRLYQAALGRQDSRERPYFWLYLDEFHHFITPSMERILSGTRKYHLGLTLAHQEFRQLQSRSQDLASSVLSNCYTRICFKLGDADSERFAGGFSFFDAKALQNLGIGHAIARVERADFDFNLKITPPNEVAADIAERRRTAIRNLARGKYARPRSDVEAALTASRGSPNEKRTSSTKETRTPKQKKGEYAYQEAEVSAERGEHRYLQGIIKRIGEDRGFVATLEKEVFGGIGRIDVSLVRGGTRIACEVAVMNTTGYEVQNIQKCLSSGFDRIVVVASDKRHLKNIRRRADLVLSPVHSSRCHFLQPEDFHLFLDSLPADSPRDAPDINTVKGYEVRTTIKGESKVDAETSRNVLHDLVSRVMRRKKGTK